MSVLLAVDPSIKSSGVALFVGGVLVAASVRKLPASMRTDTVTDCREMSLRIFEWAVTYDRSPHPTPSGGDRIPTELACEWPQIYRETKSKGSPNNLLPLSAICCGVAMLLPSRSKVAGYLPREWSGGIPKATKGNAKKSPRAYRIGSRLTLPGEVGIWDRTKGHDAIDAIGIGLYHLGRLKPTRVYPGAS